jgi:hypothetical protein
MRLAITRCSGTRRPVQDGGNVRLRQADPGEGEGDQVRRLHASEVERGELQRSGAERCVDVVSLSLFPPFL